MEKAVKHATLKFENGKPYLDVKITDFDLISNSLLNKGTGFPEDERIAFNLFGVLPPQLATLQIQLARSYEMFKSKPDDLAKYLYLRDLQDSNETLYYRLIVEHVEEMMPIVYTPTVGAGCQQYSHIYRRPRGIYLAYSYMDRMDEILANPRFNQVEAIVVSDGERILGLGDQGAGGMGIPVGKLSLYTACAGIHPAHTLPILLDCGTNNPELINDPLYIGLQHQRIRGKEYDNFIDAFVTAVKKRYPHVLLQWEDFAQQNANPILARYRDQLCTFNDDIQGTAAVATGTLLAAIQVTGIPLREQRIVIVGAGSAGCGISSLMMQAMVDEGLSEAEARSRFYLIDRPGLLMEGMPNIMPFQQPFLQQKNTLANWKLSNNDFISLEDVVKNAKPTVLIGVSGQPGIFTETIVREMAKNIARPIIFPLSNPTSRCEAIPADLMNWTNERSVIGTGSPFGNITKNGKQFRVDQTNNCYIFPGMGLGLIAVKAKLVTDKMFMAAAKALAAASPAKSDPEANLLPPLHTIREVSYQVAFAVAKEAVTTGLANPLNDQEIEAAIRKKMWFPEYLPYRKANISKSD
ncbi:MAG: NAD-dependent malic enzyme [Gammaproteobacteria bacterium]|nr:NAD-dependent malic enzyme [Gammaproteobacteria bacterium]